MLFHSKNKGVTCWFFSAHRWKEVISKLHWWNSFKVIPCRILLMCTQGTEQATGTLILDVTGDSVAQCWPLTSPSFSQQRPPGGPWAWAGGWSGSLVQRPTAGPWGGLGRPALAFPPAPWAPILFGDRPFGKSSSLWSMPGRPCDCCALAAGSELLPEGPG